MSDPQLPTIETRSGNRSPNAIAERGAVALAVLVLVGGTLIAVNNWLGTDDGSTTASGSPVAHATPGPSSSSTPGPTPTPREIVLVAGEPPPTPPPGQQPFSGWIRALATQPLRLVADRLATEVGTLQAGDVKYAEDVPDAPGWLQIAGPDPVAYIEELDEATALIERIAPEAYVSSGDIWALAAGEKGFVAVGYLAGPSDRPSTRFAAFSADGATWQRTDLPGFIQAVAWGPAGWLGVGTLDDPNHPTTWVFRSADGLHWSSLGAAAEPASALGYPSRLVSSQAGYVLETQNGRSGMPELWFSGDGVTWVENVDHGVDFGNDNRLQRLGSGFYLWTVVSDPAGVGQQAFSVDGRSWTSVADGPVGVNLKLATLGDRVIAAITDPDDGSVRFWTGAIEGSTLAWDGGGEAYPGVGVSTLVSDGLQAVAVVWDRETDRPAVWTSTDGREWTPSSLAPGAFGGIPRLAAGGPAGVVLVGYRSTTRGSNPIIWRQVGTRWAAEPSPMVDLVPDPPAASCEAPPNDYLAFTVLDRSRVAACFGNALLRFRAWSMRCEECYYEDPDRYDPQWLANPTTNQLFLTPIASDFWGGQPVVTHPSLVIDPAWAGRWIEVTGHFDDPAATSCRYTPPPAEDEFYSGRLWIVETCRQQFVVTSVRTVEGP